jgi:glycosyltransferase involved in cell wall biosynthesis
MKLPWLSRPPQLSVIIPAFNRPRELQLCLEGFAKQTCSKENFEVIVIDDGSQEDLKDVAGRFEKRMRLRFVRQKHAGPSAARNLGIRLAKAPLLLLYDDDLRPAEQTVERCLHFHKLNPREEHAALLYFVPEKALPAGGLMQEIFQKAYPFPPSAGTYDWRYFWSGTLTCKKSLFRDVQFDPGFLAVEDSELALRLSRRFDMRIHFDFEISGVMTREFTFESLYGRAYSNGYYSYRLAATHPGKLDFSHPPFDLPERYVIADEAEAKALFAAARKMAATPVQPNKSMEVLVRALWGRAELHAKARGWMAARDAGL